jgi:predicted nucleotidyltransferase
MIDSADLKTAEQIKDKLLEADGASIGRIVLHGSRATGRARPGSDYDILVVMRHEVDDWVAESMRFSELFVDHPRPVDIQVFGKLEFEECRPVPATIAYPADKYGLVLYADP